MYGTNKSLGAHLCHGMRKNVLSHVTLSMTQLLVDPTITLFGLITNLFIFETTKREISH